MVFSWNPKGSWRILLRMPFIESLNDEKWRTCWSTSVGLTQHSGDIDFAEAIENVDSVDGPNLVNNLGSPLFQYSY